MDIHVFLPERRGVHLSAAIHYSLNTLYHSPQFCRVQKFMILMYSRYASSPLLVFDSFWTFIILLQYPSFVIASPSSYTHLLFKHSTLLYKLNLFYSAIFILISLCQRFFPFLTLQKQILHFSTKNVVFLLLFIKLYHFEFLDAKSFGITISHRHYWSYPIKCALLTQTDNNQVKKELYIGRGDNYNSLMFISIEMFFAFVLMMMND